MRFVDEMYRDCVVSDRTWNALKQRYDDRMMIDATITPANYRMVSMALNILGVQSNPGEEKLPPVTAGPGSISCDRADSPAGLLLDPQAEAVDEPHVVDVRRLV